MPLQLDLSEATGTLLPCADIWGTDSPLFAGTIFFDVTARWPVLRLPAAAWLDLQGGKPRYRLSIGGLTGWLSFRMRVAGVAGVGPDYTGTLGPEEELQVAGWRTRAQGQEGSGLTLALYSSSLGTKHMAHLLARALASKG
jgi:hypothetical protein